VKIKEKFKDIIDDAITYQQQEDSFVQIADEFAIGFAEWLTYNRENNYTKSIKELLEIYKKEKGL
jgi:hypothetical protein